MENREKELLEFLKKCKVDDYEVEKLKADASHRRYRRLKKGEKSFIVMDAPPEKESTKEFIQMSQFLIASGFSAPEVIEHDQENGFLLLEDFGCYQVSTILAQKMFEDASEMEVYTKAMDVLIKLHKMQAPSFLANYDDQSMIKETTLFIEWYVSVINDAKLPRVMNEEYQKIVNYSLKLTKIFPKTTVLRDYHADNLMWLPERFGQQKIGLLDFQDAVLGSPIYDIVSLLEDARRDVSEEVVNAMISKYLKAFPQYNYKDFMTCYSILGAQRNLKIIGIFSRQSSKNKNPYYLSLLPRVWGHLNRDLKHPLLLPLKNWIEKALPNQIPSALKSRDNARVVHAY